MHEKKRLSFSSHTTLQFLIKIGMCFLYVSISTLKLLRRRLSKIED